MTVRRKEQGEKRKYGSKTHRHTERQGIGNTNGLQAKETDEQTDRHWRQTEGMTRRNSQKGWLKDP